MPDYIIRPEIDLTLGGLNDKFASRKGRSAVVDLSEIALDFTTPDPVMRFQTNEADTSESVEIPLADKTLTLMGRFLGAKFINNCDPDETAFILNRRLGARSGHIVLDYTPDTLDEIRTTGMERMDPRGTIDVALRVLGEDAPVINAFNDYTNFRFDVVVRDGSEFIGGDVAVNDITKGGLRFGQDIGNRRAPWVSTFLYRLVCTNGMEVEDVQPPIDFRNKTLASIYPLLEERAREYLGAVNHQIDAFYDLREKRVGDAYAMLARLRQEHGFSARMLNEMVDRVPILIDNPEDASMFDVVNLVTNLANLPEIGKDGGRRGLELVGGSVITEHAHRCPRCQSSITS